jgi:minor extracellular serine protease Vpr
MTHLHTATRRLSLYAALAAAGMLAAINAPVAAAGHATDATASQASVDTGYAIIQLNGDPLATAVRTKPAPGKKIDFSSTTVRSYRAQLSALRNDYKAWLRSNVPGARVTGEFDISLNAVSVQLNGATLAQVAATPMVRAAQYESLYHPTIADPDLALISATQAWAQ